MASIQPQAGPRNAWRREAAKSGGWEDRLAPGHPNKYFIVSVDNHVNEPPEVFDAVDPKYKDRLPHLRTDEDGTQWLISDGLQPQPVRVAPTRKDLIPALEEFETFDQAITYSEKMEDEDIIRARSGRSLAQRIADRQSQGIDAEICFPTRGFLGIATPDVDFATEMARVWNRWALATFSTDFDRTMPMALVATGDVNEAIREVRWAALNGFRGIVIPNRPIFTRHGDARSGLEYNDKIFEPFWSAVAETGLPMTLHVATGHDPRSVGGKGGAITNYVCHSSQTTIEPMIQMISSGVFERHPSLMLGIIESGAGWIPWVLQQMDHSYRAHHMWVRPVIPQLPSDYFRRNVFVTFMEEPKVIDYALDFGLEPNLVWASDYPHPEGSFPHCAASIRRVLGAATERQRENLLGRNAARIFNIERRATGSMAT